MWAVAKNVEGEELVPPKKVQPRQSGPIAPVNPEVALKQFTALVDTAAQLTGKAADSPEFGAWKSDVAIALSRFYGPDSEEYARFKSIWFTPGMSYPGQPHSEWVEAYQRGLDEARLFLASRRADWEVQASPSRATTKTTVANPKNVFVVHGHDHGMKETVARFLSKLGLNPIILHEQADEGSTIIEKFEKHADVSFAIAIFSGDDLGVAKKDISGSQPIRESLRPRARQNVVFEFGYFTCALGRKNVRAIVEDGVETPSDYSGVLYIPFDAADGWRVNLAPDAHTTSTHRRDMQQVPSP
jgi:predicted nucleotide-binding protein